MVVNSSFIHNGQTLGAKATQGVSEDTMAHLGKGFLVSTKN